MSRFLSKTRGFKLPILAMIGLAGTLFTVFGQQPVPAREPAMMPPVSPYSDSVAGVGVVEPKSENISIGTELPGVVRQVHVKVGNRVKADAPLFSLDQRDIDAQIKTLKAALESAKVQREDAKAQYAIIAEVQDRRAVARDDVNRRKYAALLAGARVREMEAQLEQALTTKDRLTVCAPIDGEILYVNVRPGESAPAGTLAEPLIRMGDTSLLHVRVEIDEENALKVTPKSAAKGIKRGDPDHVIPLSFVRFEPFVRPKQNLAVAGQRVDTHVLQVIYALQPAEAAPYVGEQMDVFIDNGGGPYP
jgi:RND family efflux transporter MFP subunit